jgi:hypothetical protein
MWVVVLLVMETAASESVENVVVGFPDVDAATAYADKVNADPISPYRAEPFEARVYCSSCEPL